MSSVSHTTQGSRDGQHPTVAGVVGIVLIAMLVLSSLVKVRAAVVPAQSHPHDRRRAGEHRRHGSCSRAGGVGPPQHDRYARRKNPVRTSASASPASTACTAWAAENRYARPVTGPRTAIGDFSWYCNIAEPRHGSAPFATAPPMLDDRAGAGHVTRGDGAVPPAAGGAVARPGACDTSVAECGAAGAGGWIPGGVAVGNVVVLRAARF